MSRLRKFLELTAADRRLLLEAAFWLGVARLAVFTLPFRRIAPYLGRHMAQSPDGLASQHQDLVERTSWAVQTASRHLPWECTCLAQAMAGKAVLKRRGVPNTLYLGLVKADEAQLRAHAWLRCGGRILTGWQAMGEFAVISTFAEEGE